MRRINIKLTGSTPAILLNLGRQGENLVTEVVFDYTEFIEEFGEGTLILAVKRDKNDVPYPGIITNENGIAVWSITNVDTAITGRGNVQLTYVVEDQIKKTIIFKTFVFPSLVQGESLDPYEYYLERIGEIGTDVTSKAQTVSTLVAEFDTKVEQAESDIEQSMSDIASLTEQSLADIDTLTQQSTSSINTLTQQSTSNINTLVQQAISSIDTKKVDALNSINEQTQESLEELSKNKYVYTDDGEGNITISLTS